jgi:hypothetical protein
MHQLIYRAVSSTTVVQKLYELFEECTDHDVLDGEEIDSLDRWE